MKQRTEQYNDLHNALTLMRRINNDTPAGEVYMKMYLLQNGMLSFEDPDMVS